ncbi:hypothetical protein [Clostridium sp.]|uniref:hypothetical protein n=1 Tax=Clostridium sp. TaxID=1506 RepID=UPI0020479CDD|nr:hypothetical protein [Clostridium sp.]MDU4480151.1 hypothetical protein [Clostridium sp.]DAM15900.1 MAG TPA: Head decoration protein [Caudoviricetes sp.]
MYFGKKIYESDLEILVTEKNLVSFSGTILASNVTTADENGKKYVKCGSLIDKDGNVVKQTGDSGSETLSTTPVGILYKTVDVTKGDVAGALIVEGYLRADRVLDGFADKAVEAIKVALPNIKFR